MKVKKKRKKLNNCLFILSLFFTFLIINSFFINIGISS